MPAGGEGACFVKQRCNEQYAHNADHRADGDLFAYADELHADEYNACADDIEDEHTDDIRQPEPRAEHRSGACQKCADIDDDGQTQQQERRPGENFLDNAGEQLCIEAGDKLRTVVVVRKLGDDEVEDKCDYVAEKQYPYHLTEAVVRRKIRHGQNTCADTMADDNARRLKKSKFGFSLYVWHDVILSVFEPFYHNMADFSMKKR